LQIPAHPGPKAALAGAGINASSGDASIRTDPLPTPGKTVAERVLGWLSEDMSDQGAPDRSDVPADEHLRDDVSPAAAPEPHGDGQGSFTPGQTNAGQQVGGLASAADYGKEQDPDSRGDTNNPV